MLKKDDDNGQGKRRSVSKKITTGVIAILLPSLIVLIVVSCLMASRSISVLNDKILEAQRS